MAVFWFMIGTYLLWKLSAFYASLPPRPRGSSVPAETAEERYRKRLKKLDSLPLTPIEDKIAREEARKRFIAES